VALLEEITSREELSADALDARVSLARIHFVRGDKALAQKMLTFVLQQKPDNAAGLLLRAYTAFDEGRYQDAMPDLRAILHREPKNKEALRLLGEVYLRQRHLDLAIDTLGQLVEAYPLDYAAGVRLAQMYGLNGNNMRALELLSGVTHAAPEYAVGWESMARILIGDSDPCACGHPGPGDGVDLS
jgi:predicted Zn-dependent protease